MTIETLRRAKKDTIRTLMRFGTAHPAIKYPIFIMTVIFIFVYNLFLHTLIQVHIHEKLAKVLAAVLSFAVFFTGMDLTVLAVRTAGEQEEAYMVTGFADLDEAANQYVSVGTSIEELNLPDTLEAYILVEDSKNKGGGVETDESPEDGDDSGDKKPEEGEEPDGPEEGGDGENPGGEEGGEEPGDASEGGNGEGENPGGEEPGDTGEGENPDGEEPGDAGEDGNGEGENPGGEEPDGTGEDENGGAENSDSEDDGAESVQSDNAVEEGESIDSNADTADDTAAIWQVHTAAFVLPKYFSENTQDGLTVEVLENNGNAEEAAPKDENIYEEIILEDVTWESSPAYDGETEGVYVFTPILPEGYTLAAGVRLPEISVTVEENISPAWRLLNRLLDDYFAGEEEGLYQTALHMEKDTRLTMIEAYEEVTAAMTEEDAEDERLNATLTDIREGFHEAGQREKYDPVMYEIIGAETTDSTPVKMRSKARAAGSDLAAGPISLRKLDGEGSGFYYTAFQETKQFVSGTTYAFLDDVYDYEDAVASLGSGAVLEVTSEKNNSVIHAGKDEHYADMQFTHVAYVNVITPGEDFDGCKIGGVFKVGANPETPQEYRYFCGYGGAQNCGPLYAYTYAKKELNYTHVDASLNDIAKQGSGSSWDYTVTLTIKGEVTTVSPSSYSVSADQSTGVVTITVKDSEGNQITTRFQGPLAVRYLGNGSRVTGIPALQGLWTNDNVTLSSQRPVRRGYQFEGWKFNSADSSTIYQPGESLTAISRSVTLYAAWRDIQKPVVSVKPFQVMIKTPDADIREELLSRLTITDNEPAEECTVVIEGSDYAAKAGIVNITVKVTDKAGNVGTGIVAVTVTAKPLEFAVPAFATDTKALIVVLKEPGAEAITETGFVWGIMTNPSLTLHNGKAKTTQPVTDSDGRIGVTAQNLQKGITYYARAYAVTGTGTDCIAYYSDQITIGLGLPEYGTFTIKNNNNNTFTVMRAGGSEGEQQVYFRTVNGSAVGGTHFTHQADILTFAAGETSKMITVAETGANTAYSGRSTTAYTNADRTYSVQIYRVTGGGTLGSTVSASRRMTTGSRYTVSRTIYDEQVINGPQGDTTRGDYDEDRLGWTNGAAYPSAKETVSIKDGLCQGEREYWLNTAQKLHYRLSCDVKEIDDGYQSVQITPGGELDTQIYPYQGNINGVRSTAYYVAMSEHGGGNKYTSYEPYVFPYTGPESIYKTKPRHTRTDAGRIENNFVRFDITQEQMSVGYGASGNGPDKWSTRYVKHHFWIVDEQEPQFVAVAPMAGGVYKAGDTFVVSLVFDEIVDSVNSTNIGRVSVNTNWGVATYTGGADTNVLYFTGTVKGDASGSLQVTSIANADNIKDMCNADTKTQTVDGTGSTGAQVDTSVPAFNVTSAGIANGVGTAKITVTPDQNKTTSMRYAWSDAAAMPVSGWVDMSAEELQTAKSAGGLSCSIRKEAGSGSSDGKWYLHVIGTYGTTGETTYQSALLDFGTKSNPAVGSAAPELTVSVDNSQWATQRAISLQSKGAVTLKYRNAGLQGSSWQSISASATGVTVTENGYYTFLLTAGDITITKSVTVEKIDRVDPTASIGLPTEAGTIESPKQGIYTKLTLPITYGDEHSGVKTVQYAWTDRDSTPSSWSTLSGGSTSLAYVSTETVPTTKYLHIQVTDKVGHTYSATSAAYQMISRGTVDAHTPGITLSGAPTRWTNDTATLQWSLINYAGKNYEVILPDGKNAKSGADSGQIWARRNGSYTVKVRDLDYGGENTATVEVTYIDTTAPAVKPSSVPEDWKNTTQTVTFSASDSLSGVGKRYGKVVNTDEETPADGLTELSSDRVDVMQDGVWYIYYKYYDKAGDDSIGREANKTEGFVGPIKIDTVSPTAAVSVGGDKNEQSGWYKADVPATVTFSDPKPEDGGEVMQSGVKSAAYRWMQSDEKPTTKPESGLQTLTPEQLAAGEHVVTQNGDGIWYLYYKVTDQAGNVTDGFSEEIRLDKTKASLTVTGPAAGAVKETGLTLTVESGIFGPSGGVLSAKKDGTGKETTIQESTGSGVLSGTYTVTEPGAYLFTSRTNADETPANVLRYVHQAVFDSQKGSEVEPQLVWTSYADAGANTSGTAECKVQKPADPRREGYLFGGWYTDKACEDTDVFDFDTQLYEDSKLYAKWTQDSAPEITAEVSAPGGDSGWHTEAPEINLTYGDTNGITQILVSVDGGDYQVFKDFAADSPAQLPTSGADSYTAVQQGDHTYSFQAVNTTGLTQKTEKLRVKLDSVKPLLGELSFNKGYVNLWDWIIRRDNLLVSIPVTEGESGLAKVTYTLTPGSMQSTEPVTKEAKLEKTKRDDGTVYTAVIAIEPDYKGVIENIQAVDIAGNVSEEKTAYANGIGVIVEEQKPVITVMADRLPTDVQAGTKPEGEELSEAYYQTAPELLVKVQDGSMAASGLREVKWRIGGGNEQTEDGGFADALHTEYSFRINGLSGHSGTVQVKITAVDNAGNSESKTLTVKIKGKEQTPQVEPDYLSEKLTGLLPDADYVIRTQDGTETAGRADADGGIGIEDAWFGEEIFVIRKGDGINTEDSESQRLTLAARPDAPGVVKHDETIKGKKDGQITGLTAAMEYSADGGRTWTKAAGSLFDAAAGKYLVRIAAVQSAPHGKTTEVVVGEGRTLTAAFDSQGGSSVSSVTGLSWQAVVTKPADPVKANVAFAGWFKESGCTNQWHFASEDGADKVEADVTLYAKWIAREQTPAAVIAYRTETLTGLMPGAAYVIGGKEVTASGDGSVPIEESWLGKTISIIKRGNGTDLGDSDALLLPVPNRPAGPAQVKPKAESRKDGKNGKLTKTDTTMQYRKKGSTEWIAITGKEVASLEPGDYELRYISTDTAFASEIVVKTIKKYSPPKKEDDREKEDGDSDNPEEEFLPSVDGAGEGASDSTFPDGGKKPDMIKSGGGKKQGSRTEAEENTVVPGNGRKSGSGVESDGGRRPEDTAAQDDGAMVEYIGTEDDGASVSKKSADESALDREEGQNAKTGRCALCHICPTFLGICYFIWLAVILVVIFSVIFVVTRRRKEEEPEGEK